MTIKMAAMTRTRTDISDKISVIFSHGIRSIQNLSLNYDHLAPWKSSWICAIVAMDVQERFLKIKTKYLNTSTGKTKL